jgi:hypothetical protein
MLESLFSIRLLIAGPVIIVVLGIYAMLGLSLAHRWLLPRLGISAGDSEFTGAMLQSVMVFYGLAVALIAVSVWETHSEVERNVTEEATSLAALYRDIGGYPDPIKSQLQDELRDYTLSIINNDWPQQQHGEVPGGDVARLDLFQLTLIGYKPADDSQKILHAETLRAYNVMLKAGSARIDSVDTGLPGVMWVVIIAGAFIGLSASFFFRVDDHRLHQIQSLLLATFIGLVIFMIFALDRPFRGDLGISPRPYQIAYDQLMKVKR